MSLHDELSKKLQFANVDLVASLWEGEGKMSNAAAREIERLDKLLQEHESPPNPGAAAIEFALTQNDDDCRTFLHYWNEGEFDICRENWPEAPDEVYIGADQNFVPKESSSES